MFTLTLNFMYRFIIYSLLFFLFLSGCSQKPSSVKINDEQSRKVALDYFNNTNKSKKDNDTQILKTSKIQTGKMNELLEEIDKEKTIDYKIDNPGWIDISLTKRFSDNMNRLDAKSVMLSEMRNKAINKKVSQNLQITQLITDRTKSMGNQVISESNWSGFFKSTISGMITKENEIKYKIDFFDEGQGFNLELVYSFYVIPVKGQADPSFTIDCKLNKQIFKNGDELLVEINPSLDSYLYVFNMMADNNAILMFPNEYMSENLISSKSTYTIPPSEISDFVSIQVGKLPGSSMTMEHIYILCSKKKIPAPKSIPKIGSSINSFDKGSNSFLDLQKWLSEIPLDERVESILTYYISD
jgi:hypothetical protein